jgi:hypothetical protein
MKALLDTSLNLDGHMEVYSEEEEEAGLTLTEHKEEEEVPMAEHDDDWVDQGEEVAGAAPGQEDDVALCIQRHRSSDDEGEDIHSEVATEVGAVDAESGKQVSGGTINNVRSGGEVGTGSAKGPDPPYPPDTPSESDCGKEDAGYGSGADSTVLKSERAVTWFPPLTGGSLQKRNNQSRFGPGFQGEPSNFIKRRKVQAMEYEILDSASVLPGLNQPQFAALTQPCSQAHVSLPPGAAGEGDQPQEKKDKRLEEEPEPEVGASRELWRLLNPGMPGIQPRNR